MHKHKIISQAQMETFITVHAESLIKKGITPLDAMISAITLYGNADILRGIYSMYQININEYAESLLKRM